MKAIIAVFLALIFVASLQAQDQLKKGVYSLSGYLAYISTSSVAEVGVELDESALAILPKASLFVFDRVEGSLGLGYTRSSRTIEGLPLLKYTSLEVGLGLRYYFPLENIAPFIGAEGGMYWSANEGYPYSKPASDYQFTGGLEIFISRTASIEPAMMYSKRLTSGTSTRQFSFVIGVKYFIL